MRLNRRETQARGLAGFLASPLACPTGDIAELGGPEPFPKTPKK
jgi:hypothetical protein